MAGPDGAGLAVPKITRHQVLALVAKWQGRLLLDSWKIRVILTGTIPDFADFEAQPEYLEGTLRLNPLKCPPQDLELTVVHELLHCHTWPLWEAAEDAARGKPDLLRKIEQEHERLTSTLQRIVMR